MGLSDGGGQGVAARGVLLVGWRFRCCFRGSQLARSSSPPHGGYGRGGSGSSKLEEIVVRPNFHDLTGDSCGFLVWEFPQQGCLVEGISGRFWWRLLLVWVLLVGSCGCS